MKMRSEPRLKDLHPWLRNRVNELAVDHRTVNPGTSLCLIWGARTFFEQQSAYKAGRSKINGKTKFSLHNYYPTLAADLWVYTGADDDDPEIYENRPKRSEGLSLQLLQKGSLKRWYIPMGKLAAGVGLEAGALWRTFRDGPHVQVPKKQRIKLLQRALTSKGFDVGPSDGIIGAKTWGGIVLAQQQSGILDSVKSRLMPVHPDLWAWLHGKDIA